MALASFQKPETAVLAAAPVGAKLRPTCARTVGATRQPLARGEAGVPERYTSDTYWCCYFGAFVAVPRASGGPDTRRPLRSDSAGECTKKQQHQSQPSSNGKHYSVLCISLSEEGSTKITVRCNPLISPVAPAVWACSAVNHPTFPQLNNTDVLYRDLFVFSTQLKALWLELAMVLSTRLSLIHSGTYVSLCPGGEPR